jgi:hypothetical protein
VGTDLYHGARRDQVILDPLPGLAVLLQALQEPLVLLLRPFSLTAAAAGAPAALVLQLRRGHHHIHQSLNAGPGGDGAGRLIEDRQTNHTGSRRDVRERPTSHPDSKANRAILMRGLLHTHPPCLVMHGDQN